MSWNSLAQWRRSSAHGRLEVLGEGQGQGQGEGVGGSTVLLLTRQIRAQH